MTQITSSISPDLPDKFQAAQVAPIAASHLVHDTYTAFIAPLIPVLIENFSLSLTQVGWLNACLQLPHLLNPLIGFLADKISVRNFIILAPAATATLVCSMGFMPGFYTLALLFFVTGISVAAFHAPAPAMIARVSGLQVGKGMSWFMASGELARTIGPLVAVWAVSLWTLDGLWRLAVIGWATSLLLYLRLRKVAAHPEKPGDLRAILPLLVTLFLPLGLVNFFRNFLLECLTTFLPTYISSEGQSLWIAGAALSLLEFAGVAGALLSGTLSDRLGRKRILLISAVVSTLLTLVYLNIEGWLQIPVLLGLGFMALSGMPVMLAIVQEQVPNNRATANGIFMVIAFMLRPLAGLAIGMIGDQWGLQTAFTGAALISLLSLPFIMLLPENKPG
jgi:FSR family fosmidomycin resistance protein-like MFS transporter